MFLNQHVPNRLSLPADDWRQQQLNKAGLKLSMGKCEFGQKQIEYLGKTISSTGIAPIEKRVTDYLNKLKPPNSVKALQRYLGFVNFYRSYIPRLADKTCCLQELIKKDVPFKLNEQHKDAIFEINESLLKATKVSPKLPLPDKQLVIMCDASEHAAGYVLLIEDYADPSAKQTYAPVAFGDHRNRKKTSLTTFPQANHSEANARRMSKR